MALKQATSTKPPTSTDATDSGSVEHWQFTMERRECSNDNSVSASPWRDCTMARGGHIDVACRSVCDQDQNGIKRSTFFLGADQGIKTNSERLKSSDQCTFYVLSFELLWNQAIKSLGTERSSDQEPRNGAIKRSRTIFTDQDS